MKKKIIALLSAAAISVTTIFSAFSVSAAGTLKLRAVADKTTVKPGATVTVGLEITENPGIIILQTQAVYDKDSFEITKVVEDGDPIKGQNCLIFDSGKHPEGHDESAVMWNVNFTEYANNNAPDSTYTGKMLKVTFKAKDTVQEGDYTFSFETWEDGAVNESATRVAAEFTGTTVTVSDGLSKDATLKSLTIPAGYGTLTPAFDPDVEAYTVAVPYGKGVPKVAAVKNDAKATIKITQAKSYAIGENEATVTVTAQNKNFVKTYKVTFTEINAMLSTLTVNGTAVTGFDPDTTSYTYAVPYADWNADKTKTYTIAATASKDTSTVAIGENDFTLTSTDPDRNSDKNVTVTVTADNGTETVYTIKFTVLACQHNYVKDDTKSTPATCELAGKDVSVCAVCGKEKEEAVKALGHDLGPWTTVTDATCETDGEQTQTCGRCGNVVNTKVIPKKGHRWGEWHLAEGSENTYERICANGCAQSPETHTVVDAADGHTHAFNGQTEVITPATCTAAGQQKRYCSVDGCNEWIPETIETIPHTEAERVVKEPTCTENGEKVVYCSVCNTELSRESIEMLSHDYGSNWTSDSTSHWHECTRCGDKTDVETHTENSGEITTPATTVSNGIRTYSCTVCGHVMRTETIPMAGGNTSSAVYPTGGYVGAPVIPFGGIKTTEDITVRVENKITGEAGTARAQRSGDSVTIILGAENDGNYANIYTTDDEYIYSAVIENGRVKFNVPSNVKLKAVIDTVAYGEDVSAESAFVGEADEAMDNMSVCITGIVLFVCAAAAAVFIRKRARK